MANVLLHSMIILCALLIMGTTVVVAGGSRLTTAAITDAAKIAALCTTGGLVCAQNTLQAESTKSSTAGVHHRRDASIHTINDLQRDFFVESGLVAGGKMTLDDNLRDPTPKRAFLTSTAAHKLPALTSSNSLHLMRHLGVAPNTGMATAVATAAYLCGYGALPGEHMRCVASTHDMADFVSAELGGNVKVLSTSNTPLSRPAVKAPVTILDVSKGSVAEGKRIVVCHVVEFPCALYYCHAVTGTKVISATLKPAGATDSDLIKAIGICHIDTSMWLSTHPAFNALRIPRGDEACHWLIDSDLVFVSTMTDGVNME